MYRKIFYLCCRNGGRSSSRWTWRIQRRFWWWTWWTRRPWTRYILL